MKKQNSKPPVSKVPLLNNRTKANEDKYSSRYPSRFDELVKICQSISSRFSRMSNNLKPLHNIVTKNQIVSLESNDLLCNEDLVNFQILRDRQNKSSKSLRVGLPQIKERDGEDQDAYFEPEHKKICLTQRINLQRSSQNESAHRGSPRKYGRNDGSASTCSKTKDKRMNISVANLSTKEISVFEDGNRKTNISIDVKKLIEAKLNKQSVGEMTRYKQKAKSSLGYYEKTTQKIMR